MSFVDEEAYSRVDTQKLAEAADDLDKSVQRIIQALENIDAACTEMANDNHAWKGDAAYEYYEKFDDAMAKVKDDAEKYKEFPKFMRFRLEQYIKGAMDAELIATGTKEDIDKILAEAMELSGGGTTIAAIRDAYRAKNNG